MRRNKIYLVDSENINIQGIEKILALEEKQRKIYIFYTRNTQSVKWTDMGLILKCAGQIHPVECYTGQNALDFQLVSLMGGLISKAPKSEYIIFSNDKGYDSCVSFWSKHGVLISRITRENRENSNIQSKIQERKRNLTNALEDILSDTDYSFDLDRIVDVFITCNHSKKDIAPALFKSIGNKETSLFLTNVGKNNLKKLYEL